jgi:hypothetical protein
LIDIRMMEEWYVMWNGVHSRNSGWDAIFDRNRPMELIQGVKAHCESIGWSRSKGGS